MCPNKGLWELCTITTIKEALPIKNPLLNANQSSIWTRNTTTATRNIVPLNVALLDPSHGIIKDKSDQVCL